MARPKKPTYEFIPSRNEYRKRIKGPDGKYIALYAQTPDELTEKVALAQRQIEEAVYARIPQSGSMRKSGLPCRLRAFG